MIKKFNEYLETLNEGIIKTTDIDQTINSSHNFLSKLKIDYEITKFNNKILLKINSFDNIHLIRDIFNTIESYFINMNGWFPSTMDLESIHNSNKILSYNNEYLIARQNFLKSVTLYFESKFDIEDIIPNKLYHLSIQNFEKGIIKYGLVPKEKSKLTQHPDRIYVCKTIQDCKNLIYQMKFYYSNLKIENPKNKINDKWIIYEIDTTSVNKLYKDPNYNNGFYILNPIKPSDIKIIEKE
jgi:hypothetical protein